MKFAVNRFVLLLFLVIHCHFTNASHLVGGEMSYQCLGNGQYQITMNIFRDDFYANPNATLDDPATITIYNRDNNSVYATYYKIIELLR